MNKIKKNLNKRKILKIFQTQRMGILTIKKDKVNIQKDKVRITKKDKVRIKKSRAMVK